MLASACPGEEILLVGDVVFKSVTLDLATDD